MKDVKAAARTLKSGRGREGLATKSTKGEKGGQRIEEETGGKRERGGMMSS